MTAAASFLRVIDLETTGNSFTDGGVVEIGWQDLRRGADGVWTLAGGPQAILIDPRTPISSSTSAIHHIIDEDVVGAPLWTDAAPAILSGGVEGRPAALAAHRSAFEQRWCAEVQPRGTAWICTYKCALRLWPEEPGHSNQGLRYSRRPDGLDRALGLPAHRAGPDAYVTAHHLRDMLALADVPTLLAWSAEPALLVRVPFGRLRGRRFVDLPTEELARLADGSERMNTDVMFSARRALEARGEGAAPPVPASAEAPRLL
jgi:exodeoxyribonuclease X